VSFDDAACERERKAHSAALFVERAAIALVCRLYGAGIADDHHGCALAVLGFAPPLGDHDARTAFFTQNRPENGVERRPKPCRVAAHLRRAVLASDFQSNSRS
jgi:hypothetical protein